MKTMSTKDLYEWTVKHHCEDLPIAIYADDDENGYSLCYMYLNEECLAPIHHPRQEEREALYIYPAPTTDLFW